MATRRNPFCSKRLMISPTRPRCTPSGLMAMKVRSAWAMVLREAGAVRASRPRSHRPRGGPGPGPRAGGHVAPAPASRYRGDTWPAGRLSPASAAPQPLSRPRVPAEDTRQGSRGSAWPAGPRGPEGGKGSEPPSYR